MNYEWNAAKIAQILKLPTPKSVDLVTSITTDSRQVKKGSAFIAIKGDTHDGHDFISKAIELGALVIISEKSGEHPAGAFFQVPSTLTAIRNLANAYRKNFSCPVIAIVGAVGKTTTKELISSLLGGKFSHVTKTEGSQNGFLGIPLTLLSLTTETQIAVIEIGIDEIGAMEKHLEIVQPTHAILTKIGPEHLHQLKTVEIAAEEELKAFDYAIEKKIPIAINVSDEYVAFWFQNHQFAMNDKLYKTYSLKSCHQAEYTGTYQPELNALLVVSKEPGQEISETFSTPLPGEHHAHNLLAAITLSSFFHLSVSEMKTGLATFRTAYGRTEIYRTKDGVDVIGDHYNSNPTSLLAAIALLTSKKGAPHYHAALGDMLELGDDEERFHREMAQPILNSGITHLWLYGDRMKWLYDELKKLQFKYVYHFQSHSELSECLKTKLSSGDQVLVKGSRGMIMEKVLKTLVEEVKNS